MAIRITSITEDDIKTDLQDFLDQYKDKYPVITNYTASVKNQVLDLLAAWGSFLGEKFNRSIAETNLSTCVLLESGYINASDMGYNVQRAVAPTVLLKYVGDDMPTIKCGDDFGSLTYQGTQFNLTYFGDPVTLHQYDTFECVVGQYYYDEGDFIDYDFSAAVCIKKYPGLNYQFDNNRVNLIISDTVTPLTKDAEWYLLNNQPVILTSCSENLDEGLGFEIDVYLPSRGLGYPITKADTYKLEAIITTGYMALGDVDGSAIRALQLDDGYQFVEILGYGTDSDTLDDLKLLAPLSFLQAKRNVTQDDWETAAKVSVYTEDARYIGYDQTNRTVTICYTPRDGQSLTDWEVEQFKDELQSKAVSGQKVTVYEAEVIEDSWLIQILYYCNSRRSVDTVTVFEQALEAKIKEIVYSYNRQFELSFTIKEIESEIQKITLDDVEVVRLASISRLLEDGTTEEIGENTEFVSTTESVFNFSVTVQMTC